MNVGRGGSPGASAKTAQSGEESLHAWKLFRGACITTIAMWFLIIVGRCFEMFNGERMLLKQEGRVERWPSHVQPWMSPWSRFGTRNEWCHAGGCDRRLSQDAGDVSHMAHELIGVLRPLVHGLEAPSQSKETQRVVVMPQAIDVAWPADLQPMHLAAAGDLVVALARDRRGVVLKVTDPNSGTVADLAPFHLHGLDSLGEVSGGTLAETGLTVAMDTGALAECAGLPINGIWACQQKGPKLPNFGAFLKAAVAAKAGAEQFRAVVVVDDGEEEGTLILLETDKASSSWLPTGEVRVPAMRNQMHLSLSPLADSVFVAAGTGEVLKWELGSGEPTEHVSALPMGLHSTWHAACPLGGDHIVQLATQPNGPKLYVRANSV